MLSHFLEEILGESKLLNKKNFHFFFCKLMELVTRLYATNDGRLALEICVCVVTMWFRIYCHRLAQKVV